MAFRFSPPALSVNRPMAKEPLPLVGIIMGSKSDWETMSQAADVLAAIRHPPRMPGRLGPPHARLAARYARRPRGAGWRC